MPGDAYVTLATALKGSDALVGALRALVEPKSAQSSSAKSSGRVEGKRCCQLLEKEGGAYGCDLPSGHSGPHFQSDRAEPTRPKRSRSYTDIAAAAAAMASARDLSPASTTVAKVAAAKTGANKPRISALRVSHLADSPTTSSAGSPSLSSYSSSASPAPSVTGVSTTGARPAAARTISAGACTTAGESARRSSRATAGAGPSRLGTDDGWGRGPAGAWASSTPGGAEALAEHQKQQQREESRRLQEKQQQVRAILRPIATAGLALQQKLQQQQQQQQQRRQEEREQRRQEMARLAKADPAEAARLREIDEVETESERLQAMSYEELYAEKRAWIESPPTSVREEFPTRSTWGKDWSRKIEKALNGRLVRKRYVMSGLAHATNFGRVVGCEGHWFEVLYEDGYYEALSWHDLSRVLVPHATRDAELARLEQEETEGLVRSSRREKKQRDLDAEVEAYLPRQGCHHSLPVGAVACHLHEELRMSGLVPNDPGPEVSD